MSHACEHHEEHQHYGLEGAALAGALEAAEARCEGSHERLTAPRRKPCCVSGVVR